MIRAPRPDAAAAAEGQGGGIELAFSHVDILVGDLAAAVAWHRNALDCRASEPGEWRRGDFHVVSATLFNAGERFILVQPFSGWLVGLLARMGPGTIYRLAYTVPDVRAAYARLLAKGIVPVDESLAPLPEERITSPAGYDILWLPPNEASPSVELLDRAACEAAMARTAARAR